MKTFVTYDTATGMVYQAGVAPLHYLSDWPLLPGQSLLVTDEFCDGGGYGVGDVVVPLPPQPSVHHEFDWVDKVWRIDSEVLRADLRRRINVERQRRTNLPISFDGKLLDADKIAQDNVKAKLTEIRERIELNMPLVAAECVWRDANNVTHQWPNQEAYRGFLGGFAIAMSQRGTALYQVAWQKKAEVDALTGEALESYDPLAGWQ